MRHWPIISAAILIAAAIVIGVAAAPVQIGHSAFAPADACPVVPNTPNFTLANGEVRLDGVEAPAGTLVTALSPRGDVVGCTAVSEAGHYGAVYIYGEDTLASPAIPGMKDGETVSFRVNGLAATAAPALVWRNDWATHPITLTAWVPTPTPTPSPTPTPTSTPTVANRPDLIVKSIQVAPAAPVVGQALAVMVTLKNQGTAAAVGLFYSDVYADYVPSGCNDVGWAYGETIDLVPGDVAILSFTYAAGFSTTGLHFIRAFVDSSCQITEADETNNINLLRVTVSATPLPPVAAVVTAMRSGGNIVLTWPHASANASYQVWRGTSPYFVPNGSGAAVVGDGATGNCTNTGVTATCTVASAIGDPGAHYFVVRAFNSGGAPADSNRVGEFGFALQPGN